MRRAPQDSRSLRSSPSRSSPGSCGRRTSPRSGAKSGRRGSMRWRWRSWRRPPPTCCARCAGSTCCAHRTDAFLAGVSHHGHRLCRQHRAARAHRRSGAAVSAGAPRGPEHHRRPSRPLSSNACSTWSRCCCSSALFVFLFDPGMAAVNPDVYAEGEGRRRARGGRRRGGAGHGGRARAPARRRSTALVERVEPRAARRASPPRSRTSRTCSCTGMAVMRDPRAAGASRCSCPSRSGCRSPPAIWLVTVAFHMTIPFTGSFLIVALLVVGVAVPTPGAVGGFHEAFRIGDGRLLRRRRTTARSARPSCCTPCRSSR